MGVPGGGGPEPTSSHSNMQAPTVDLGGGGGGGNVMVGVPGLVHHGGGGVQVTTGSTTTTSGVAWFNKTSVRHFMRICSVASLISVCANTSRTFAHYPSLMLITFIVDIVSGLVFTIEMVLKIYTRSLFNGPSPYARDRWCQFDATMVLFIWISIVLQVSLAIRYLLFSCVRTCARESCRSSV